MRRGVVLWVVAVVVTLVSGVYQRVTGPTYPVRFRETLAGVTASGKLLRTQTVGRALPITVRVSGEGDVAGLAQWRRFPTEEPWQIVVLRRDGDRLVGELPEQDAMASKVEYRITLTGGGVTRHVPATEATVARFKGAVPLAVLLVHILVMFLGMLWSLRTGLEALARGTRLLPLATQSLVILAIGGLILGPLLQKYAFGVFWAGWPLGEDLTDNKLAAAVLVWLLAVWRLRRAPATGRWWAVAATVVTFAVFMIPHSRHGSTFDYTSGEQIHALATTSRYPRA